MNGLGGGPQGEQVQSHDLYVSLLLLGYQPVVLTQRRKLTAEYLDGFDVVITDYHGVNDAMDKEALQKHRCKIRLLDLFGTDAIPNMREGCGYCCLKLPSLLQFWTFAPNCSADNAFLGATIKSFRPKADFETSLRVNHRHIQVLLYGKVPGYIMRSLSYVKQLTKFAPTHATVNNWPVGILTEVHNHAVLSPPDLHRLMQESFVYAGFAEPLIGPAAIEAMSQGMIFLNYAFVPVRNLSKEMDKPTTQLWTSQFPFLETQTPHVITVNANDADNISAALNAVNQTYTKWWVQGRFEDLQDDAVLGDYVFLAKTRGHRGGYVPFEYTTVAMLQRVAALIALNVCDMSAAVL